jgi:hypothetical protein
MTALHEQLRFVESRQSLAAFVRMLHREMRDNPAQFENSDLKSYLAAMAAWIDDMDGYYANRGEDMPAQLTWRTFAEVLIAAAIYE